MGRIISCINTPHGDLKDRYKPERVVGNEGGVEAKNELNTGKIGGRKRSGWIQFDEIDIYLIQKVFFLFVFI